MNLKVCDSIMGSGKTEAAISLMNDDTEHNYIFITPYLKEIERIKQSCPNKKFVSPQNRGNGKLDNLHYLFDKKENIVSTHALFKTYTPHTIELIKNGNYKLILDEVVDAVEVVEISQDDLQILFKSNSIKYDKESGKVSWIAPDYEVGEFWNIKQMADSGNLILYNNKFMYWLFPIEVFKSFKEVIILTYLFDSQIQKYYFDMNNITYDYIYTEKTEEKKYIFCDTYKKPEYVSEIKNKINILEDEKLNCIGDSDTALSSSWFKRKYSEKKKPLIQILKNNIINVFVNRYKDSTADNRLWTTFKDYKKCLSGKGYTTSHIPCNLRATNEYRHKKYLAYCINVYFIPHLKNYFLDHEIKVKEEQYALSEMIQWIWRSAIRDGEMINIYIPSRRMRELLQNWLLTL